ncbi:MAG: hypothetical protein CL912_13920 [Deltaproteobacteria bacterium]|nr:hypothetical protein [Deltaproteobacteria bacterium]
MAKAASVFVEVLSLHGFMLVRKFYPIVQRHFTMRFVGPLAFTLPGSGGLKAGQEPWSIHTSAHMLFI